MAGDKSFTAVRAAGFVSITDLDGSIQDGDTLQCVHCGCHWILKKGSGRARGWCRGCGGPHCGAPGCFDCYPIEKRLDDYENGRLLRLT